jgi:hypothetical protein
VQKRSAVDRARRGVDEARRRDVDLTSVHRAQPPAAHPLDLLHTVPGIGTSLRRVRRDAIQQRDRWPQVQAFASSGRLVTGAKAAAGKRWGTAGAQIGTAPLPRAFSAAAVFGLREPPAGQKCCASLENKPGQGQALTGLAHP